METSATFEVSLLVGYDALSLGNWFLTFRDKSLVSKRLFNWFIPVVCEYNVKYLRDIRRVRQNTTLYYDVVCHRTDNMFRPFTIRPSSGLTSSSSLALLVRPDDGLIVKGRNMLSFL